MQDQDSNRVFEVSQRARAKPPMALYRGRARTLFHADSKMQPRCSDDCTISQKIECLQ